MKLQLRGVTLVCGLAACAAITLPAQQGGTGQTVHAGSDAKLLSTLTVRLSLSPGQQQAITVIMDNEGQKRAVMEASWSKTKPAPTTLTTQQRQEREANYKEETSAIEHVLTHQQRSEFRRYTTVEVPVEHQLNRLQQRYQLSNVQRDALRPVVTDVLETMYRSGTCLMAMNGSTPVNGVWGGVAQDSRTKPILTKVQWTQFAKENLAISVPPCHTTIEPSTPSLGRLNDATISDITLGITHIN